MEVLGKRLLSCPTAFAESWSRARQGFSDQDVDAAGESELAAAERAVRQETGDDREAEQREATAATVVGAWLRNFVDDVGGEIRGIERALDALGFTLDGMPITDQAPLADARFDSLVGLIERLLRVDGEFRDDERLIVFTEYKTTLDYLARRLRERYPADRVLTLFGTGGPEGMDEVDRENVKAAFNDLGAPLPHVPARILDISCPSASSWPVARRHFRWRWRFGCRTHDYGTGGVTLAGGKGLAGLSPLQTWERGRGDKRSPVPASHAEQRGVLHSVSRCSPLSPP